MPDKAKDAADVFGPEDVAKLSDVLGPTERSIEQVVRYTEDGREIRYYVDQDGAVVELYEMLNLAADASVAALAELQAQAGVPIHVSTEQLVNRQLVWLAWNPQQAFLPETGEYTDGFFCVLRDQKTKEILSVFVGGVALTRILKKLPSPHVGGKAFRADIEKHGRTWVFR